MQATLFHLLICVLLFLSLYLPIDVLIYSAPQLQECLVNLLTYMSVEFCGCKKK